MKSDLLDPQHGDVLAQYETEFDTTSAVYYSVIKKYAVDICLFQEC